MIWIWFKRPHGCGYLWSSVGGRHYLFWWFGSESTKFCAMLLYFIWWTRLGGHSSGFSRKTSFWRFEWLKLLGWLSVRNPLSEHSWPFCQCIGPGKCVRCLGWSGFRSGCNMTGLALHADPTCVPSFCHDGKQVGVAWGVGWTWWWCCGAQFPQKSWLWSGTPFYLFFSVEKRFKGDGYEESNSVDMAPFFLASSFFFFSPYIVAICSDKHIQVQFPSCGSHSSKPSSYLSQFH